MRKKVLLTMISAFVSLAFVSGCGNVSEDFASTVTPEKKDGQSVEIRSVIPQEIETSAAEVDDSVPAGKWIPEIIDRDTATDIAFDDSVKHDYNSMNVTFQTVNGTMTHVVGNGTFSDFRTTSDYALTVSASASEPFRYGTLSCDVKTPTTTDSGIVFGLTSNISPFWEFYGVSYYFFFLGRDKTAYLGKTVDGNWFVCKIVDYTFNASDYYNLKVVWAGGKICCYVNGDLVIGYRDLSPLQGGRFGVRSSSAGAEFRNIVVKSDYEYL